MTDTAGTDRTAPAAGSDSAGSSGSAGSGGSTEAAVGTSPEARTTPAPSSWRDRLHLPTTPLGRHLLVLAVGLLVVVVLLQVLSPFRVSQIATLSFYVAAVAGLSLLTGINGQISLGHGAFMAVGAYTAALLLPTGLPFVLAMVAGAVVAGLVGVIVGAAAAQLHGPYLAGATLALAVGLPGLAIAFDGVLGGDQGLTVPSPEVPGWFADAHFFLVAADPTTTQWLAYVGVTAAGLVLFVLANLGTSRYGRVWRAVRDDEVAAELAGLRLGRLRVLAFVVSAVCAGLAGTMLALVTRLVAPTGFGIVLSLSLLAAAVIGGLGSLVGAVLGSAVIVFLPPLVTSIGGSAGLSDIQSAELAPLTYGVVLVLVMVLAPGGAAALLRRLLVRGRPRRNTTTDSSARTRRSA